MTAPSVMQADAACGALLRTLRDEPGTGTVHSVFDHAVNIEFGKELVSLLSAGRSLQPFSGTVPLPRMGEGAARPPEPRGDCT